MIPAIVPAAGLSRRMGRPKLTLRIGAGGETVIDRVVHALRLGGADGVIVVVPPPSQDGAEALASEATAAGATIVPCGLPTADMRQTVEVGLSYLAKSSLPLRGILLAPADSPGLTPGLVARVLERSRCDPDRIIVPSVQGRRGHPVAIPWGLAATIPDLPTGEGVNALLKARATSVIVMEVDDPGALDDLDTPADLRRWVDPS